MQLPQFLTYIRGQDTQGSGEYGASRDGGKRTHKGIDLAFQITAISGGFVTKIGYPYDPNRHPEKAHFRYVEITDEANIRVRYFYVDPTVKKGDFIVRGDTIGFPQDLTKIYPGITPHIHFECRRPDGIYIDPAQYLEDL